MRFYHWGSEEQGGGQPPAAMPSFQINDETELEALCAGASQHLATESLGAQQKPCCRFTYLATTGRRWSCAAATAHPVA